MKTKTWAKDSWHYRLATVYSREYVGQFMDICSYTRLVLKGAFVWVVLTVACCLAAAAVGDALAWIAAVIVTQTISIPPSAPALAVLIMLVFGMIVVAWYSCYIVISRYSIPADNPVVDMYRALKQRTCVKINFVDKYDDPSAQN